MTERQTKAVPKVAETVTKLVALLEPLESDDRQKAIKASLTILGETSTNGAAPGASSGEERADAGTHENLGGTPAKAKTWMRQNTLTLAQVEEMFDVSSGEIIGSVPGKSDKEKTHNTYVLVGIGKLLTTGDTAFDDKAARKACEDVGCYDKNNHGKYMNARGNELAGSKDKGWKLTAPGLKRGANLVKQLPAEG